MKSLESVLTVRSRLLSAFEAAEQESDPERRAAWLTSVVGAGPTGVEMAGQIEFARDTLPFRIIDPRLARIVLIESADRVLTTLPPSLSAKAERSLQRLGVTVLVRRTVTDVVPIQGRHVADPAGTAHCFSPLPGSVGMEVRARKGSPVIDEPALVRGRSPKSAHLACSTRLADGSDARAVTANRPALETAKTRRNPLRTDCHRLRRVHGKQRVCRGLPPVAGEFRP